MEQQTIQNFAAGLVQDMREQSPEVWEQVRTEVLVDLIVKSAAEKVVGSMTLVEAADAAITELVDGDDRRND